MPKVVADIDKDLKRWLQIHALDTERTMSEIVADLIQEYHDRIEGGASAPAAKKSGKQ